MRSHGFSQQTGTWEWVEGVCECLVNGLSIYVYYVLFVLIDFL
jgi:hypothetical protein